MSTGTVESVTSSTMSKYSSVMNEYQTSVWLCATAPDQPSPGPRPWPGRSPSGSSCHVIMKPAPLTALTSIRLGSRRPEVSRSALVHTMWVASISSVRGSSPGSSTPRAVQTQPNGTTPACG